MLKRNVVLDEGLEMTFLKTATGKNNKGGIMIYGYKSYETIYN